MTLVVQDTNSEVRTEIRYALLYFLTNVVTAADLKVSLITFSNDTQTEAMNPVQLTVEDEEKLKSLLVTYVKMNKNVPNVCLICGLRKAYKVSTESQHPQRVIVLFAFSSSLQNSDISKLTEVIRGNDKSVVLYLIFLEDASVDAIPYSLEEVMLENRGRLIRVKNDRVFLFTQMNVALLEASRNFLHIEDKIQVIHQKTHNVVSNFLDVFRTPKNLKGRLLYSMQCKNRGDVRSDDNGCSILDQELQSPICESKSILNDDGNSSMIWKYFFEYMAGSEGSTCVSLALLKLDSPSMNTLIVKGWFNENKITPGVNAVIIYAEIIGRVDGIIRTEAIISGPGLTDFRLELRDNGNGDPDIIKGDNIYSRYFTSFSQKGTYTVSVYVEVSTAEQNMPEESSEKIHNVITQTKVIGSFRVTETPPKEDVIAPNRICDLNVVSINSTNKRVSLQWTAPGDDYDNGKATGYKMYYTDDWRNLQEILLNKISSYTYSSKLSTKISENEEKVILQLPNSYSLITYYVALKAFDKKGNKGKLSNIVQVRMMSVDSEKINLTTKNDTKDEKETIGIETENSITNKCLYIFAGFSSVLIIITLIINILIWIFCFKKYKRLHKATKLDEMYNSNTRIIHTEEHTSSSENVLRNEYQNSYIHETGQNSDLSLNQNFDCQSTGTRNPQLLYAKVDKRNKNQESRNLSQENSGVLKLHQIQTLNQKEDELGFV